MREKVCCILDRNENYAVKLTEYINNRHALPYRALAFTSADALVECADAYDIEILVADEAFSDDGIERIGAKSCVVLAENAESDNGRVCRYQAADDVIKDIIGNVSGYTSKSIAVSDTKVVSVYSPATKCFKTTTALAVAIAYGRLGKTLFISLEQFAGLDGILRDDRGGLSEAIYYYHIGGDNAYGKILSCSGSTHGFDYLSPVVCADDVADLTCDEIVKFVSMLAEKGGYLYIVADVGCVFNRPWKLLEVSDRIIMPEPLDYMGIRKVSQFEKYLMMSGRSGIENKICNIKLPYIEEAAGYEIGLDNAGSAAIQEAVRRCLDG